MDQGILGCLRVDDGSSVTRRSAVQSQLQYCCPTISALLDLVILSALPRDFGMMRERSRSGAAAASPSLRGSS